MKTEERLFTIFLLVLALLMAILSVRFSPGPRTLPLIAGICTSAMIVLLIVMAFSPKIASWYQKFEKKPILTGEDEKSEEKKRMRSVVGWFSGCMAGIYFFGYLVTIPLYLFVFLKIKEREGWLLSLSLSAVVLGVVYFVFIYLLRIPLHKGILLK